MTVKERLHQIIDELPEYDLPRAEKMLEDLRAQADDPFMRRLMEAPIDDEPETEEERLAVQEAYESIARGEVVTDEEFRREFGL